MQQHSKDGHYVLKLSGIKNHFKNADNVIDASVDGGLLLLEFLATPVLIPIRIFRYYLQKFINSFLKKFFKIIYHKIYDKKVESQSKVLDDNSHHSIPQTKDHLLIYNALLLQAIFVLFSSYKKVIYKTQNYTNIQGQRPRNIKSKQPFYYLLFLHKI